MNQPKMTRKDWRGAVIGMALGDGSLYQNPFSDGSKRGNYKLCISHSIRQAEYLKAKRDVVNQIFDYQIPVTHRMVRAKKGGKKYPVVRMQSRVHSRLSFIAKHLIVSGKKRITDWALDNITLEGLAYWWMDDGCLHIDKRPNHGGGFLVWGTYGFPDDDVIKFRDWMEDKYGVSFRYSRHKKSGGLYLRRGLSEGRKIIETMDMYSIPSMRYKFDYAHAFKKGPYNLS